MELPLVEREGDTYYLRHGTEVVVCDKDDAIAMYLALGLALKEADLERPSNGLDKPAES